MKRSFSGYCAAFLSLAMVVSTMQPALARNGSENGGKGSTLSTASPSEIKKDDDTEVTDVSTPSELKEDDVSTPSEIKSDDYETVYFNPNEDSGILTLSDASKKKDNVFSITYNLGDKEVVVYEDEDEVNHFNEDGSFVIEIPDDNPYFPYEVQFKNDDYTTEKWFMTPDDTVRFAGHDFTLSVDDLANYSHFELEVGGESVPVYPEKKTFTNKNGLLRSAGWLLTSLARVVNTRTYENGGTINVDLTGYTPVELTRVKIAGYFTGEDISGKKIMWTREYDSDDVFTVSSPDDYFDLSQGTNSYKMVVGEDDQLKSGKKYTVNFITDDSSGWLKLVGTELDEAGNILHELPQAYSWYSKSDRTLGGSIATAGFGIENKDKIYAGFDIDDEVYPNTNFELKIFEGNISNESGISDAKDITELVKSGKYYGIKDNKDGDIAAKVTLVSEKEGEITGILPIEFEADTSGISFSSKLYDSDGNRIYGRYYSKIDDGIRTYTYAVSGDHKPEDEYKLCFIIRYNGVEDNSKLTAAFLGKYDSISEANNANAVSITDFIKRDGYSAKFNDGVIVSLFVGEDGDDQKKQVYKIVTIKEEEQSQEPVQIEDILSGDVHVQFTGLVDEKGDTIPCYFTKEYGDSYGEFNFPTIIVDGEVDLKKVAPVFVLGDGVTLYAKGSKTPEQSGESYHDLSSGVLQYTSASEDGEYQCNYWLQVVKPTNDNGLYINSLVDNDAKTERKNDTIYTTREVLLDSFHSYRHDIVLLNMGTEAIGGISAELESDTLELDDYWTLTGDSDLLGYSYKELRDFEEPTKQQRDLDERPVNFANIRLTKKDGVKEGTDVDGKLTIKSGEDILAVITLTGIIGDPIIITDSIPDAVKYVPYGTMIQNSNKYSWNHPVYELEDGKLPEGMELKENGELYGVPKETGDFEFTVVMKNDSKRRMGRNFSDYSSTHDYVLHVVENTDPNVEGATDESYELRPDTEADLYGGRVPDFTMTQYDETYTMVSNGAYDEFKYIFLDGEKLTPGDDYSSESGSTRITIKSQVLRKNGEGTHTLGVEFRDSKKLDTSNTSKTRTSEEGTLKRSAQNYHINKNGSYRSNSSSSSGSSGGSGSSSTDVYGPDNTLQTVAAGYWEQLDNGSWIFKDYNGNPQTGWKYIYLTGAGPRWFHFNDDGTMSTGWVYSKTGKWYYMKPDGTSMGAMETGWVLDPDDNHWYYIDPKTGTLATGWRAISGFDYYFNEFSGGEYGSSGWKYDETSKKWKYEFSTNWPLGAMLRGCVTPDGSTVDAEGKKIK